MADVYYTSPMTSTSAVLSATTTEAGSSIDYLLDGNLDTYWTATSSSDGQDNLIIDTRPQESTAYLAGRGLASGSIQAVGTFIVDEGVDYSSAVIHVESSSDASTWTTIRSTTWETSGPLYYTALSTAASTRYYRFRFTNLPTGQQPKISQLFLLNPNVLDRPHGYPITDVPEYISTSTKSGAGRKQITRHARYPITRYSRNYLLLFPADQTMIETIYNQSAGMGHLFILDETNGFAAGGEYTSGVVCQMDKDLANWSDIEYSVRTATYTFSSVPYIRKGETS